MLMNKGAIPVVRVTGVPIICDVFIFCIDVFYDEFLVDVKAK